MNKSVNNNNGIKKNNNNNNNNNNNSNDNNKNNNDDNDDDDNSNDNLKIKIKKILVNTVKSYEINKNIDEITKLYQKDKDTVYSVLIDYLKLVVENGRVVNNDDSDDTTNSNQNKLLSFYARLSVSLSFSNTLLKRVSKWLKNNNDQLPFLFILPKIIKSILDLYKSSTSTSISTLTNSFINRLNDQRLHKYDCIRLVSLKALISLQRFEDERLEVTNLLNESIKLEIDSHRYYIEKNMLISINYLDKFLLNINNSNNNNSSKLTIDDRINILKRVSQFSLDDIGLQSRLLLVSDGIFDCSSPQHYKLVKNFIINTWLKELNLDIVKLISSLNVTENSKVCKKILYSLFNDGYYPDTNEYLNLEIESVDQHTPSSLFCWRHFIDFTRDNISLDGLDDILEEITPSAKEWLKLIDSCSNDNFILIQIVKILKNYSISTPHFIDSCVAKFEPFLFSLDIDISLKLQLMSLFKSFKWIDFNSFYLHIISDIEVPMDFSDEEKKLTFIRKYHALCLIENYYDHSYMTKSEIDFIGHLDYFLPCLGESTIFDLLLVKSTGLISHYNIFTTYIKSNQLHIQKDYRDLIYCGTIKLYYHGYNIFQMGFNELTIKYFQPDYLNVESHQTFDILANETEIKQKFLVSSMITTLEYFFCFKNHSNATSKSKIITSICDYYFSKAELLSQSKVSGHRNISIDILIHLLIIISTFERYGNTLCLCLNLKKWKLFDYFPLLKIVELISIAIRSTVKSKQSIKLLQQFKNIVEKQLQKQEQPSNRPTIDTQSLNNNVNNYKTYIASIKDNKFMIEIDKVLNDKLESNNNDKRIILYDNNNNDNNNNNFNNILNQFDQAVQKQLEYNIVQEEEDDDDQGKHVNNEDKKAEVVDVVDVENEEQEEYIYYELVDQSLGSSDEEEDVEYMYINNSDIEAVSEYDIEPTNPKRSRSVY
ncbi:hypothetical protein PPL_11719 [Heterostelium album PN500]|uniref:Uncharacterized protein n=1 Tax=Heterostelium pallidum (strain ATCC 26659 / Pp 5 / PN500) TaxID=670386 RepID=D3BUA0_HETP5|nr:hypothetical protein PPL_11719 [Heterostelium album PN500]EFA75034.1 hypothetical protein PPL_11719 [Heterostelium album PN500]|eukprot:XP_020427168.1 hypothetical protein PPL_11719 [Heterostelium album PN500]